MGLDIRLPIGLLFVVIGAMLAGFGWLGDRTVYERSLHINVNLEWGLFMVLTGLVFLWLSRRHTAAMHPSEQSVEGRATEAREHATGLEGPDPQ